MPDITYTARSRLFQGTQTFSLTNAALVCAGQTVPLDTIARVRLYTYPGITVFATGTLPSVTWCKVERRAGRSFRFRNQHIVHPFVFEDRIATFQPFVKALCLRLASMHPAAPLVTGLPPVIWWTCVLVFGAFALVGALGFLLMLIAVLIGATKSLTEGFLFVSLFFFMFVGAATYLSAIWRDRTRPLDPLLL